MLCFKSTIIQHVQFLLCAQKVTYIVHVLANYLDRRGFITLNNTVDFGMYMNMYIANAT